MQKSNAQVVVIEETFSSDTIFQPFSVNQTVYSIQLYGSIQLYSDSSLVRVVLVDTYGNHLLIFESYPLITDTNSFTISGGCDETCFLDGIVPDSIRVDIISAFCTLDSLKLDTNYIPDATQLQAQAKWNSDSVKISIMNTRIKEEHMFWRAGRTFLTEQTHQEKEIQFGDKYNLKGYDYYKGGLFEVLGHAPSAPTQTEIVTKFDWRSRHDADKSDSPYYNFESPTGSQGFPLGWISPFQCQQQYNTCYAFAAVYYAEALVNLFFNNNIGPDPNPPSNHQINLDLSQEQIIVCQNNATSCTKAGDYNEYTYMCQNIVVDETCFPFQCTLPLPSCTLCTNPIDGVSFGGGTNLTPIEIEEDNLKGKLIQYGPISCCITNFPVTGQIHMMVLVGFSLPVKGDTVYFGDGVNDPPIVINENYSELGVTQFYFKDSYNNYFINLPASICNPNSLQHIDAQHSHYLVGPIDRPNYETPILCSDEDGDGYYWWGVNWVYESPNPFRKLTPEECNCPFGVNPDEEDCNDNKVEEGYYDTDFGCMSNCDYEPNNPEVITTSPAADWEIDRHYNRDLIIKSGATVVLRGATLWMGPNAKIIIEKGARLELRPKQLGANEYAYPKITAGCGVFWKGIQIWGDPTLPQDLTSNQGTLVIIGGTIENALCGIMTGNTNYTPDGYESKFVPYPVYPSGGIIQADGATFRNNKVAIEFCPYKVGNKNLSYIHGCSFVTDDELLNNATPDYFLKLDGINKLDVLGCTFENKRDETPQINYSHRGRGIYSYNSEIYLNDTTMNSVDCDLKFTGLEYGLYGLHSGLGTTFITLHNGTFSDNKAGIYLSGYQELNPLAIYSNEFTLDENYNGETQYGIYLDQCSGYKVQQNTISGDLNIPGSQYGIIVNNSGSRTNFIYDNDFYELHSALQSQNVNRGCYLPDIGVPIPEPEPETGLCFKCNNFHNCVNDIVSTDEDIDPDPSSGMTIYQGTDKGKFSPTAYKEPAGNTFSETGQTDHVYDIDMDNTVHNMIYIHHQENAFYRVIPDKDNNYVNNPDKVTTKCHQSLNAIYDPSGSCPDFEYPTDNIDSLTSVFSNAKEKIDSLLTLIMQIIDEGSTDEKNEMVLNSAPSQSSEVYLDLMVNSPYLSDTVLKSAADKEDVLSNEMITDIMSENPQSAKNESILNLLNERFIPLSDSMWTEVLKGIDSIGEKEQLEAELLGWIQVKELVFNEICKFYLTDSVSQSSIDSLSFFIKNDHIFSNQILLAYYFIDLKRFSDADNILDFIPEYYSIDPKEDSSIHRLDEEIPLLEALFNDTLGNILPDSTQQIDLLFLYENNDLPGVYARNILINHELVNYREPLYSTSNLKTAKWYRSSRNNYSERKDNFKIYPNPCKDFLNIVSSQEQKFSIIVQLINPNNQVIRSQNYPDQKNLMVFSLSDQPTGVYFIRIIQNGITLETHKVVHFH